MQVNDRAGQLAAQSDLVDVAGLVTAYYAQHPDPADPGQQVAFGTSGHRGSAFRISFNDDHIAATTQAICEYRARSSITGPLYIGRDTHALSEPAFVTALEVLAANDVRVLIDSRDGYTPTPALSRAILLHNEDRADGLADGIVVTPSHNPPEDGGFKYNPPDGGPRNADHLGHPGPGQRAFARRPERGPQDSLRAGQRRRGPARLPRRIRGGTAGGAGSRRGARRRGADRR